jgi:hypothetical protein
MQRISKAGQQFAYRYLHTRAKALYVRQAIIEYNKLFEVINVSGAVIVFRMGFLYADVCLILPCWLIASLRFPV